MYNPLHIITKIQPTGACLIYRYGGSFGPELSYVTPHELIIYLESTQRNMQVPHLIGDTLDESAQSGRCILNSIIYLTIYLDKYYTPSTRKEYGMKRTAHKRTLKSTILAMLFKKVKSSLRTGNSPKILSYK